MVEFSSAAAGPWERIGRGLIVADRQPEIEAAVKFRAIPCFYLPLLCSLGGYNLRYL